MSTTYSPHKSTNRPNTEDLPQCSGHIPLRGRPAWRSALTGTSEYSTMPSPGRAVSPDHARSISRLRHSQTGRFTNITWWLSTCRKWPHGHVVIPICPHWFRRRGTVGPVSDIPRLLRVAGCLCISGVSPQCDTTPCSAYGAMLLPESLAALSAPTEMTDALHCSDTLDTDRVRTGMNQDGKGCNQAGKILGRNPATERAGYPQRGDARTPAFALNYATGSRAGFGRARIPPKGSYRLVTAAGWQPTTRLKAHHADFSHSKERGM